VIELIGRERLVSTLWERLSTSSLVLLGPRRVGKSRMLEEMQARPRAGFELFRVNLEGAKTVRDAIGRIERDLDLRGVGRAIGTITGVEVAGVGVTRTVDPPGDWEQLRSSLLPRGGASTLTVVALDEVPWWLDAVERSDPEAPRTALAELRRLRSDTRLGSVRWILTGSVGIASRAGRWGADAELNDLDVIEVLPLAAEAGRAVFEVECAGTGRDSEPGARDAAHALAGGRPHWIRILAQRASAATDPGGVVTAGILAAEGDRLLGAQLRHLLRDEGDGHFGREYTATERRISESILTLLAPAERPLPLQGIVTHVLASLPGSSKAEIRDVVHRLVEEFYLVEPEPGMVRIAVPLFARWWARWGFE
jgi:hypothetical protein